MQQELASVQIKKMDKYSGTQSIRAAASTPLFNGNTVRKAPRVGHAPQKRSGHQRLGLNQDKNWSYVLLLQH